MTTNEQNTQHTQGTQAPLTVLVTGATGRVGSRVAEAARAAGHEVRSASRSGAVRFDWYDASTWANALRGADAAFLAYQPDVGAPGAAEAVGAFARQAVDLGVRHLVLLSARGEEQAHATEDALAVPGARWTVVRASWFAQNLSEGPLADAMRESGELAFPGGEVLEPFIDVRDIADVVLAVLGAGERYGGRVLEVSGGRLLSFRDAVAAIVDEETKKLLATAHQEAFDILEENRDVLDSLVLALLERETLDKAEVAEVFEPLRRRPIRPAWTGSPTRNPSAIPPVDVPVAVRE